MKPCIAGINVCWPTNESYYAWMDEGFTTYASNLTMGHLFGRDEKDALESSYGGYYALASSEKEEPLSTHADHFSTNFAYGLGSYHKGAVSVAQLGYLIGQDKLGEGLRRYYYEWRFKHPDQNDFIRVMEKVTHLELDWYYEYWINTTHTIDYAIADVEKSGKQTKVSIDKIGIMPMPLDITVTLTSGEVEHHYVPLDLLRGEKSTSYDKTVHRDWGWVRPNYELTLDIPKGKIEKIEIDPSKQMADVDQGNNLWEK